ncbi:cytochrome c biogenesis protein DipZ [Lysinibacter cavernae]
MLTLALIGLIGGLITGISPCILPVLPVIFFSGGAESARGTGGSGRPGAGTGTGDRRSGSGSGSGSKGTRNDGAPSSTTTSPTATLPAAANSTATVTNTATSTGPVEADEPVTRVASRWRPYQVVGGLVVSFSLFTLLGSIIISLLGLPQDVLRWAALIVLLLIGLGLIFPPLQHLIERPFARFPQKQVNPERRGFGLGFALGAIYVPCAGPVLAAITVAGSTGSIGVETVVLTVSFAIGTAIPLLAFALAGRRVAERVKAFRKRQKGIRITGGILMIALAIGLVFDLPQAIQKLIPDYTAGLQDTFNNSEQVKQALDLGGLVNDQNKNLDKCSNGSEELESCGTAPDITGIDTWLNTKDGSAIDLKQLKGQVVLIDFWAYSCINCLRSIPHVASWSDTYKDAGLTVVGIHSPEYAFEKEVGNVKASMEKQGITYPVGLDNNLSTWTNYRNRYWPAHYLIDAEGTVRHIKFGEGGYQTTEKLIRELLTDANPEVKLPAATEVADQTPTNGSTTQETYLSPTKAVNFAGTDYTLGEASFDYPSNQPADTFALNGDWNLTSQGITSPNGTVRLKFTAQTVRMVLGGEGSVTVTRDGTSETFDVSGPPDSYPVFEGKTGTTGTLEVTLSGGVDAYSFTFG